MFAVKFSVKLWPTNMGFINYSRLKFSPDFQNKENTFRLLLIKNLIFSFLTFSSRSLASDALAHHGLNYTESTEVALQK